MTDPDPPSLVPAADDGDPLQPGLPVSGLPVSGDTPRWIGDLELQNPCRYSEAGARRIRPWLTRLLGSLAPSATSLAVRFVSDREMRRLNGTYRHRDKTTDVLSFPGDFEDAAPAEANGEPADPTGERHLGDLAISVPTARRQAATRGHAVERELRILLLHGILHCLGYDHETDDGTMERLEARLRSRWIDHG